ncbi:aldose 1-epimerase [Actinospongicola halichondriae]|uniref:aldose epimerase family protein n=1 Tax=Actinospongicola halichondriae TaxID=3236844 RepID=UPI003D41D55B
MPPVETLHAGDASLTIDRAAGGRLSSLTVDGHELLVAAVDDPMRWGSFPMIPWAGRVHHARFEHGGEEIRLPMGLPPHAIHGTTYLRPWTSHGPGASTTDLGDAWPWKGRAHQTVRLGPDHLDLTITVTNDDVQTMPVSAGWHPWFRRTIGDATARIELPGARMWRRDPDGIPDGTLVDPPDGPWDDCFTDLDGPVIVRWPGILALTVESDCRHVVVYDEEDRGVCVEPQSAPPDSHNSGHDLVEIAPGESWTITTTWRWRRDHVAH